MSIDIAIAYLRERYRPMPWIPLAAVLAFAGLVVAGPLSSATVGAFASAWGVAFLLTLAFRIWDDVEDRERDAQEHPERIVVRAMTRVPFGAVAIIVGAVAVSVIATGAQPRMRLAALAIGVAVLFAWYRGRRFLGERAPVGAPLILAKYPLIAFVSAAPRSNAPPLGVAVAVFTSLYLALLVYEITDDARVRGTAT
jgi:4-hydroxybenzoate polyprenyltransferase